MKKILLVLSLLCTKTCIMQVFGLIIALVIISIPSVAIAQDNTTFKLGVGYANKRYNSNPLETLEYSNGLVITGEGKETSFKGFKLSGVITFEKEFGHPIDVYGFGQKLSYPIGQGGVVEPFVQFTLNLETQYEGQNTVSRTISYGADLNAGSFYFRPIEVRERRSGGAFSPSQRSFIVGVGFRK